MLRKVLSLSIPALTVLLPFFLFLPEAIAKGGSTYVKGYFRKNGTYVAPHYRSSADGNPYNNWSTAGNVNPYTGKAGTRHLDGSDSAIDSSNFADPSGATLPARYNYPNNSLPNGFNSQNVMQPPSGLGAPGRLASPQTYQLPPSYPVVSAYPETSGSNNSLSGSEYSDQSISAARQAPTAGNDGQEDKFVVEVMNADLSHDQVLSDFIAQFKERLNRQWMPTQLLHSKNPWSILNCLEDLKYKNFVYPVLLETALLMNKLHEQLKMPASHCQRLPAAC